MRSRESLVSAMPSPRSVLGTIPDGPQGTRVTLRLMAGAIRRGRTVDAVRRLALGVVASVPSKNYGAELARIRSWVREHVRYTRDVRDVETLQTPEATLRIRQGDCDDHAILLGSLLESIGFRTRLVAIGRQQGQFGHVYLEAQVPRVGWISAETTEAVPLGWTPPWPYRMQQEVA